MIETLKQNLPEEISYDQPATTPEADQNRLDLAEVSRRNLDQIRSDYVQESVSKGQFPDAETAVQAIHDRLALVEQNHALTINMSASSAARLVRVGHMETYWDHARAVAEDGGTELAVSNGKNIHEQYDLMRTTAEQGIGRYAPAGAQSEPVYAAIAGPREVDSGACPAYGNWWVTLDSSLEESAVYSFADSHASVAVDEQGAEYNDDALLNAQDALEAKAITELVGEYHSSKNIQMMGSLAVDVDPNLLMSVGTKLAGYVEAAIYDDNSIELDKVLSINAKITKNSELAEMGQVIKGCPEIASKLHVKIDMEVDDVTQEWLQQHFPDQMRLKEDNTRSDDIEKSSTNVWERLGVSPNASYTEVAQALEENARTMYRRVAIVLGIPTGQKSPIFKSDGQWQDHMRGLYSAREKARGSAVQKLDDFIELQEARVFFAL